MNRLIVLLFVAACGQPVEEPLEVAEVEPELTVEEKKAQRCKALLAAGFDCPRQAWKATPDDHPGLTHQEHCDALRADGGFCPPEMGGEEYCAQ